MSDSITVTHNGVVIIYVEHESLFRFELRGRSRSAESLAKAREAIDKPVNAKQEKTFVPVECWHKASYSDTFEIANVTSIAESTPYRNEVWCSIGGGSRCKHQTDSIFTITEENKALRKRYETLTCEIEAKRLERIEVQDKMERLKIE